MAATESVGRAQPHSLEAEEYLLSCCLLDGADIVERCLVKRISAESFYDPKHGTIFEAIHHLYINQKPIEVSTVAEEVKTKRQLDAIGGYAFLAQVSSRIPTTAQAGYFIDKVHEQHVLRQLIRAHTAAVEDCYVYSGDLGELRTNIRARTENIGETTELQMRPLTSYGLPPEPKNDPTALLGRNRYIGRGDGAVVVSSSGMGKSVMCVEWAVCAALGRPFMGIETHSATLPDGRKAGLKSLIIQSEDSDGDVGEVVFSVAYAMKLSEAELEQVSRNVIVVRDKVNRGDAFIAHLRRLVKKIKPDLVWLNPLHSFAGCDIANATELGHFLRGGLNGANSDDSFAYMIVHHTPKPITGKAVADKKWHEFMYDAAGSAELVNWARAILTLKPTDTEGDFHLVLAKRGKRAGVRIKVTSEAGIAHWEPTLKIPMKHSKEMVKIDGRAEEFPVVHWEMRDEDPRAAAEEKPKKRSTSYDKEYDDGRLLSYFPASDSHPAPAGHALAGAAGDCGITKSTFYSRKDALSEAKLITQPEVGLWRRTAAGDKLADAYTKKIK
jgi:hypothetical protein